MADSAASPSPSYLRRKITIPSAAVTPPQNGTVSRPPPSPINLRLISSNSKSYTSLKDILPSAAAVNSPTAANSGCEISIRNRLVKQAAWAYLQPMSASSYSAGPNFLHRFLLRFSAGNPISGCFGFISGSIIPAIFRAVRFCICLNLEIRHRLSPSYPDRRGSFRQATAAFLSENEGSMFGGGGAAAGGFA